MFQKFLPSILFIFSFISTQAQFDKKITFNAFIGAFQPLGAKIDPDSIPYAFPNFKTGGQLGLGVQYNINPRFSAGLNLVSSLSLAYKDPIPLNTDIKVANDDAYKSFISIFSLGIDGRYKFFNNSKFNPYCFGEINFNIYRGKVEPHYGYFNQSTTYSYYDPIINSKYTVTRYNAREISTSAALGLSGGIGFDLKVSNTFVLFLQGGYNIKFTKGNDVMLKNMNFVNTQLGLRFSLFKSKSLL